MVSLVGAELPPVVWRGSLEHGLCCVALVDLSLDHEPGCRRGMARFGKLPYGSVLCGLRANGAS